MRLLFSTIVAFLLITSCGEKKEIAYDSFGAKIDDKEALTINEAKEKFESLKDGDTLNFKFTTKISDVCQKKGCWMKAPLNENEKVRISFKDYGFFAPKNLAELQSDVVLNGKAFINVISVDQLKHYAEDAGKSEEEIAKITEPKRTLSFEADGILVAKPTE
jgi:hypothetical protein